MTTQNIFDLVDTWNNGATTFTAVKMNVTDTASAAASLLMDLQVGSVSAFNVSKDGSLKLGLNTSGTNIAASAVTISGSRGTGTGAGGSIIFQVAPAGSTGPAQNSLATFLEATSARAFNLYNTTDVTTNFERGKIAWESNVLRIGTEKGGTGTARALEFQTDGTTRLTIAVGGNGAVTATGALTAAGLISTSYAYIADNNRYTWASLDTAISRDASNAIAVRDWNVGTNAQNIHVYGTYTSTSNYQRTKIATLRASSGALSGASHTTTIAIPAYANLIGVTTRVTTAITGATTYDVGDGSDVDLWGAAIGIALGSQSRTADFTAVAAAGAAATSRTVTLTANGSNFTGGVVEICLHYLTTEAD